MRIVIPKQNPVFPARCVITNSADNLIWIDGNLDALANPALTKKVLPVLVAGALVAGAAGGESISGRTVRRVAEGLGRQDVPSVCFAVTKNEYDRWLNSYTSRNKRFKSFLVGGGMLAFGSVAAMFVLLCAGIGGEIGAAICGGFMMIGFLIMIAGAVYGVINVQPLLHALEIQGDTVSVKGCGEGFLEYLSG